MNFYGWRHHFLSTFTEGSKIPLVTGLSLAIKMRKSREVIACSLGNCATNTGAFHEGLNLASVRKLPIVLIREDNQYQTRLPRF